MRSIKKEIENYIKRAPTEIERHKRKDFISSSWYENHVQEKHLRSIIKENHA